MIAGELLKCINCGKLLVDVDYRLRTFLRERAERRLELVEPEIAERAVRVERRVA